MSAWLPSAGWLAALLQVDSRGAGSGMAASRADSSCSCSRASRSCIRQVDSS
jgi:hypothetical protein